MELPILSTPPINGLELSIGGDGSFQVAHFGEGYLIALRRSSIDWVGSVGLGVVSDLGFRPRTYTVLPGSAYQYDIWIDSNSGGGAVGVCDSPAIDHQWRVLVPALTEDVEIVFSHDDATVTDVCSTFPAGGFPPPFDTIAVR